MKNLVYVILFILLGGCVSPSFSPVEIHQRVAEQVKVLIDSGYLQTPYIEINEVLSNDSSIIYSIVLKGRILQVRMVQSYLLK